MAENGTATGRNQGSQDSRDWGDIVRITFPQMKQDCIQGKFINLPK
jgi:hypothetical protein